MPQVYLTQDGDINDSHPGYTSGVELDISTNWWWSRQSLVLEDILGKWFLEG